MAAGLPCQDHVWITTNQFVRFHKDEFDEILCKLIPVNTHVRSNKTQACLDGNFLETGPGAILNLINWRWEPNSTLRTQETVPARCRPSLWFSINLWYSIFDAEDQMLRDLILHTRFFPTGFLLIPVGWFINLRSMICFKVGLGISRTNTDSQWNPVYSAFHRFFCCGNETIRQ